MIVFSAADEAIFSEALHERYARVEFRQRCPREDPLHEIPQESLADVPDQDAEVVLTVLGRHPRCRNFTYDRSAWDWACLPGISYDPPTLNAGQIWTIGRRLPSHGECRSRIYIARALRARMVSREATAHAER